MNKWKNKEEFKEDFIQKAHMLWAEEPKDLNTTMVYQTLAYMIRDLVSEDWIRTNQRYDEKKVKQVYYFPLNF